MCGVKFRGRVSAGRFPPVWQTGLPSRSLSRVSTSLTFHPHIFALFLSTFITHASSSHPLSCGYDFAISSLIPISPLKPTSCINFSPYSSLPSSPTGCSWFNLRLDVTSGPHAVSSPFSTLSLFRVSLSLLYQRGFILLVYSVWKEASWPVGCFE